MMVRSWARMSACGHKRCTNHADLTPADAATMHYAPCGDLTQKDVSLTLTSPVHPHHDDHSNAFTVSISPIASMMLITRVHGSTMFSSHHSPGPRSR